MSMEGKGLGSINDDVLSHIFSFLLPSEILCMRKAGNFRAEILFTPTDETIHAPHQVNRRLNALTKWRAIWINACSTYILKNGYPFSGRSFDSMSNSDLEYKTCRAFHLAAWWISGLSASRHTFHVDATSRTPVYEVRFMPGHAGEWILTLSKGIWDIMTVWGLHQDGGKLCEWSPRGALFKGMSLNSDSSSNGTVAISVFRDGFVPHSTDGVYHWLKSIVFLTASITWKYCPWEQMTPVHTDFDPYSRWNHN